MEQVNSLKTGEKFKKTEIGEIPVDWEVVKLNDVAAKQKYAIVDGPFGSNLKLKDYVDSGIPVLQGKNITSDRLEWFDIRYISEEKARELSRSLVKVGDILMTKIGTVGCSAIVDDLKGNKVALIPANLMKISLDEKKINCKYLHQWLIWSKTKKRIIDIVSQTAQPAISLKAMKPFKVTLPPLSEQKKISEILITVDTAIEKSDQVIEKIKELKKGLMQQLLTRGIGHTKFKKTEIGEIPVDWEVVMVNEICSVRRGASPRPIGHPKYFSSIGRGWVRIADVTNVYKFLRKTSQYLSETGESKSVRVDPGDLIMTICATIGKPIIIDMKACIHDGFVFFQNLSKEIDTEYLFYFLQRNEVRISSKKQIGTQGNLNTTIVGKSLVPKPPLPEQIKIVEILTSVDEQIEKENANKEELKMLKKSLMQVLLTGKVRVRI